MNSEIGKPLSRLDGPPKVTGGARYTADTLVKDVAYGILLPPSNA